SQDTQGPARSGSIASCTRWAQASGTGSRRTRTGRGRRERRFGTALGRWPRGRNEAAQGLVSSYAIDVDEHLLLFDPLAVPGKIEELAAIREPVVVLTSPWHERDTRSLPNDVVLWVAGRRAVIAGDTLVDFGHG